MGQGKRASVGKIGVAITLVMLLLLAACGSDEKSNDASNEGAAPAETAKDDGIPTETGPIGPAGDEGSPADGGVLRVILGTYDHAALDPIKNYGTGFTGLNEVTAIFDTLMRYDPEAEEYVPKLAESLTANDDHTEYTLKLRPDVKFSDGTPLDSAAVKFGFERFSGPGSVFAYGSILPEIASMETPDPLTVVIKLVGPDPSFPYMLTLSFGQVVSPTAAKQAGEEFGLHPVGAGPFMVENYTPGVEIRLVRNPNYWGPAPHLEGITFTWASSDQAKVEALKRGDADVINVADPVQTQALIKNGNSGFGWLVYGDPVIEMNQREGSLFADNRLRRAVALALDPDVVNDRVYKGLGLSSKELFPSGTFHSGEPGIEADPDKARELVAEVKESTGWDGSFTLLSSAEPRVHEVALNVQAMLNGVGFDAVVETPPDWTTSVYVKHEYDAVVTSLAVPETDPWTYMILEAGGDHSPSGFQTPEMDTALVELRSAATKDEMTAATKTIQEIWNEEVPSVWLGGRLRTMFWSSKVRGLVPTASSVMLFDEAWVNG
jgi:peptide/nickel transport system substrate-binding protein